MKANYKKIRLVRRDGITQLFSTAKIRISQEYVMKLIKYTHQEFVSSLLERQHIILKLIKFVKSTAFFHSGL